MEKFEGSIIGLDHPQTKCFTHQTSTHVKANIFGGHNRHIEQRYVETVPKYGHFEFRLELRLVEAREGRSGIRRLKMSRRQEPACHLKKKLILFPFSVHTTIF